MKTRTKTTAKVASKSSQPKLQTTLARHSISRDFQDNLGQKKTSNFSDSSNSNLSSHHLGAIALLPKRSATTSPSIGDCTVLSQFENIQPLHTSTSNTVTTNIGSSKPEVRGFWKKARKAVRNFGRSVKNAWDSGTKWFTEQFNGGKNEAQRILNRAKRKADRVIKRAKAKVQRINKISSRKGKRITSRAKRKARRIALLARIRARKFLRQRERVAEYLIKRAKTQADKINQDAKSRSQRMMQRGEYTAARALLYKERKRAKLLVYRHNRYAKNILAKARPIANRIIFRGRQRSDRIIRSAQRRADRIIRNGRRRASIILRYARQKAARIRAQGQRDADRAIRRKRSNVFQKLAGWIGDAVGNLLNAVGRLINSARNLLNGIVRGAINLVKSIAKGIRRAANAIYKAGKRAISAAKQIVKQAVQIVTAIAKEAYKIVKQVVQTIIDVVVGPFKVLAQLIQLMRQIGGKVASVAGKIAKNPLKFGESLINGGKAGFNRFTNQFSTHLKSGMQGYLFGETNLKLPNFDASGIITMLLQTVGISRDSVRQMAVDKLGEDKVNFAEGFSEAAGKGKVGEFAGNQAQTYKNNVANQVGNNPQVPMLGKLFSAFSQGGKGITNFFKELNISELIKTVVIDGIKNFLIETIQNKAIPFAMAKLAASATPVVGWVMAAIDGLKMANEIFVKRAKQVQALVDSLGDAVVDAASHAEGGVASQLEAGMKKAIPILMAALTSYAGIDGIPKKIQGVIGKGKAWVNENVKPYISKIIDSVGSLIPDLSGKQLAGGITSGLGMGNLYDKMRNYFQPHTQKPFETFNDAQTVVNTAQTVFKPLGINTLNLEPADNTGHTFNVIAAKPLPGKKPAISAKPIRISRKPNINNNIYAKKIQQSPLNLAPLKSSQSTITSIQAKKLILNNQSKLSDQKRISPLTQSRISQSSIQTKAPKIQRQVGNNVSQIKTKQANQNKAIYLCNDTNNHYSIEVAWLHKESNIKRINLKPGQTITFDAKDSYSQPKLAIYPAPQPNSGKEEKTWGSLITDGGSIHLTPGKHDFSSYVSSKPSEKGDKNKQSVVGAIYDALASNDLGAVVQSTEAAEHDIKTQSTQKTKPKKIKKLLKDIGKSPVTKVLSKVMAVVGYIDAIRGLKKVWNKYKETGWTWKLALDTVENFAVLIASAIGILAIVGISTPALVIVASIAAAIAGGITIGKWINGYLNKPEETTPEKAAPNKQVNSTISGEQSISIKQFNYMTSANKVWLVPNPSFYNQYQQGKKSFNKLSKGTKLEIINTGQDRKFNQTEDKYKWVEVVTSSGQKGWIMKSLITTF